MRGRPKYDTVGTRIQWGSDKQTSTVFEWSEIVKQLYQLFPVWVVIVNRIGLMILGHREGIGSGKSLREEEDEEGEK